MLRLSPLRLRVFRTCRLRYRYQYLDRIPARLRPQDTVGTLVHNLLSTFLARVPPEERTPERLLKMFREGWAALSPRYRRMPGVDDLRQRAEEQLCRFGQQHDLQAQPFLVEAPLRLRLAPDILLLGRLDRVDEEPDGSLHIIDYKTGAHPDEVDADQIRLYAIMAEEALGRPVSRASFWYLDDGTIWTAELGEEDKREARAQALADAQAMQAEKEFAPTIGMHCAHCPYLYACQARQEIEQRRQREGW